MRQHARLSSGPLCLLYYVLGAIILLGCEGNNPRAPLANYLSRLSLALTVAPPSIIPTPPLRPPPVPAAPHTASVLETIDTLSLLGCAAQQTIRRRQTSLARHAKPSQQLLLTLAYLRLAPACIKQLRTDRNDALANLLQTAWQQQHTQLPALIFKATLGSVEFHEFWLAEPPPGNYPPTSHQTTVAALHAINDHCHRWLSGDFTAPEREFEQLLGEVAGGAGGAMLQSLSRQHHYLLEADRIVMRTHATIAPGVARNLGAAFTTAIAQPAFLLARRYRELLAPLIALEAQLASTLPTPYRRWSRQRDNFAAQGELAPDRHLQQLALLPQEQARTNPRRAKARQNWLHWDGKISPTAEEERNDSDNPDSPARTYLPGPDHWPGRLRQWSTQAHRRLQGRLQFCRREENRFLPAIR